MQWRKSGWLDSRRGYRKSWLGRTQGHTVRVIMRRLFYLAAHLVLLLPSFCSRVLTYSRFVLVVIMSFFCSAVNLIVLLSLSLPFCTCCPFIFFNDSIAQVAAAF